MTLICCPIHVDGIAEVDEALAKARRAVLLGAKLIEWRADVLAEDAAEVAVRGLETIVRECPVPSVVTIRPTWEGGMFGGSESHRISVLEAVGVGAAPPRYIDVELDAYRTSRNRKQKLNLAVDHDAQVREVQPRLILSSHDFRSRPADLMQRVAAMAAEPACAVMKLAWTARSIRDNLEAFDLLAERAKPAVALCMGEFGLLSRVLAPKFGGLFTFAALERGAESAPGQPTIDELRNTYRYERIGRNTRVFGVIGWPVRHSRGPRLHNAGFDGVDFDGVYLPLPVPAEYEHFKASIGALVDHPRLDFGGASVTIPHKEHCVRFVRERGGRVGGLAAALGAANTIVVEDGALSCANTDAPASVETIARALRRADDRLGGARIAVLGAGGVARAVAGGVALAGGEAVVFARDVAKADRLVGELAAGLASFDAERLDPCESSGSAGPIGRAVRGEISALGCGCFDAFVNCTPVGMSGGPDPDHTPIESLAAAGGADDHVRYDGVVVMDTVYAPERTPWLREAADRGAHCVSGIEMFVRQAERQFRRWTGQAPPEGLFDRAARET
ncbi:MAG: type I 3-dehydroquinate dehydratase [Phycisphaerales bacterium]